MPGYGARFWAERTADNRRRAYPKFRGKQSRPTPSSSGADSRGARAHTCSLARGLKVMLLEADRLAGGATSGSLGTLLPEPDAVFSRGGNRRRPAGLAPRLGREARKGAVDFAKALKTLPAEADVASSPFLIKRVNRRDRAAAPQGTGRAPRRRRRRAMAGWTGRAGRNRHGHRRRVSVLRDGFAFDPVRATLALARRRRHRGRRDFRARRRPAHAIHAPICRGRHGVRRHPHATRHRRHRRAGADCRTTSAPRPSPGWLRGGHRATDGGDAAGNRQASRGRDRSRRRSALVALVAG